MKEGGWRCEIKTNVGADGDRGHEDGKCERTKETEKTGKEFNERKGWRCDRCDCELTEYNGYVLRRYSDDKTLNICGGCFITQTAILSRWRFEKVPCIRWRDTKVHRTVAFIRPNFWHIFFDIFFRTFERPHTVTTWCTCTLDFNPQQIKLYSHIQKLLSRDFLE
jgi:hypothetical protein